MLLQAKSAALGALNEHADRLSRKIAEKAVRARVIDQIPGKAEIEAAKPLEIRIDIPAEVAIERSRFEREFEAKNLEALIQRYPVRETQALSKIAESLGFKDRQQYERAVLKLLIDDSTAVDFIRSLFGTLSVDLAA